MITLTAQVLNLMIFIHAIISSEPQLRVITIQLENLTFPFHCL